MADEYDILDSQCSSTDQSKAIKPLSWGRPEKATLRNKARSSRAGWRNRQQY